MDQGPAIRIRAPRDGSGLRTSNQGPQDESGPAGRIRAPQDVPGPLKANQGPAGQIRAPCDEPGLSRRKRGPPHRIYFFVGECAPPPPQKIIGKAEEFFTPRGPKPSSPRVLLGCLRVKH